MRSGILVFVLSVVIINSVVLTGEQTEFNCSQYWLPSDAKWDIAYDSVLFYEGPLIVRSSDSIWAVNFPGSIVLQNDTMQVNQELGKSNQCAEIGKANMNEPISIKFGNKSFTFIRISSSRIRFNELEFKQINHFVENACWCEWSN